MALEPVYGHVLRSKSSKRGQQHGRRVSALVPCDFWIFLVTCTGIEENGILVTLPFLSVKYTYTCHCFSIHHSGSCRSLSVWTLNLEFSIRKQIYPNLKKIVAKCLARGMLWQKCQSTAAHDNSTIRAGDIKVIDLPQEISHAPACQDFVLLSCTCAICNRHWSFVSIYHVDSWQLHSIVRASVSERT